MKDGQPIDMSRYFIKPSSDSESVREGTRKKWKKGPKPPPEKYKEATRKEGERRGSRGREPRPMP